MKKAIGSNNVFWRGGFTSGFLVYENEKITGFGRRDSGSLMGVESEDFGDLYIIPGLVDTHVHINEPGRTDWEGFKSATEAAAAGGITTLVDMPLNCIPVTTSLSAFKEKLNAIQNQLTVDVAFHGGVIPGNTAELESMVAAGIGSFKAFMIDSGIEEFPESKEEDLKSALSVLAKFQVPLLLHAELDVGVEYPEASPESYDAYLQSRPNTMEDKAIELAIRLCEEFDTPIHIVHLSSATALPLIDAAKKRGVKVSVETCPHYLCLHSEDIPDGDGRYKCSPPIREKENQRKLWQAVESGLIDFVVSDHSPCTPVLKHLEDRNLKEAWGGISSLQFGLALLWPEFERRGFSLQSLLRILCEKPARLVGLHSRKGRLDIGYDADFIVFDPKGRSVISRDKILHRHKETPYLNREVVGKVLQTYLRGRLIYSNEKFLNGETGKCLLRNQ